MTNSELLAQTQLLSRAEKFKMMEFLISELAKEEGLILGDEAAEIIGAVHTSNGTALQLMQLLESGQKQAQNV